MKVIKKAKNDDDIFGLNSLLGLNENDPLIDNHVPGADHVPLQEINNRESPIDLNSQPLQPVGNEDSGSKVNAQAMTLEIEATKTLGEILGVNLGACESLIQQSVIQEGLQSGGLVSNYWGGMGYEFDSVNSVGNSGGLLSIWDPKFLVKDMVLKDPHFLLVSGFLADGKTRINILNVYAPQNNVDKRYLWEKIIHVIQLSQGWWILFGDFDAVRDPGERQNSTFDPVYARDFNEFVDEAGLREFDLKGMKYTYLVNRCGVCKLSRIDRVFVCDNIFNKWSNAHVRALSRDLSDHAPLLLSLVDSNFGPIPFRWFDSWLERPGCLDVINSILCDWVSVGPPDLNLSRKLKSLKNKLTVWIKESRLNEYEEEKILKQEKEDLELIMEQQELEESELWVWSECVKSLQEINVLRSRDVKQKSRIKWAGLGDENSSYFHNILKGRQARNAIPGLEVRGEWLSKPALVKREVLRFFRDHFKENMKIRPIAKVGENRVGNDVKLNSYFAATVGDGSSISFWADSWLLNEPLRFVYPNLFRIERYKWANVADRIQVVDGVKILTWDWRMAPSNVEQPNTWYMKWKGWAPLKCKVMAWRAAINRLPTKVELMKRGVPLQSDLCIFCRFDAESASHLFTGCIFATEVWSRIATWCRLPPIFAFEVTDLINLASYQVPTSKDKYILRGIMITSIWALWNERNNRIFKGTNRRAIEVVEHIKSYSFFWIRNSLMLLVPIGFGLDIGGFVGVVESGKDPRGPFDEGDRLAKCRSRPRGIEVVADMGHGFGYDNVVSYFVT
ncbi:RNA-directed DNA polymerase, eukaryota, Reverse transcriptase zinc-binding domain protein [Artemisia annua]|uniref:RNA-directed DNA polymerase, eukaryota, Reverse transcriptase zinc-binding domain protein n=1 Tax=Artemisia annua TaxID=35608 RepID=A0A2U1Q2W3_ARTAN|nr:RNA-directed DNA polymerase, eukaryota, Reverse transcriptase zinc-binding domain protein [Artemisia annua]